ncbi:DNA-binding response regulator [Lacihabitans sp. LS3-19]|uniref:response regulator n=1 Tax=Lacihabitans sp. LS3-19 TaxID=2487335 RepID=UPI0020CDE4E3|nr:response regulator transcription factor [Lacihabitans sp. LS3-19]MCP9770005.1 DNA-binding response regulator [Lacihabitans sp. LS3-19]
MASINIFITDDHLLILEGLSAILESIEGIEVVGMSQSATATLEKLQSIQPDLLITDFHMPGVSGQELLREVKKKYPKIKVLILSMHEEIPEIVDLIKDKADGYILKNSGKEEFIVAIQKVMVGEKYFSSSIVHQLLRDLNNPLLDTKALSNQELKIAKMLANGLSSPIIAEQLFISVNTVNTHKKRIYAKLNISNLQELVKLGAQKGWF